MSQDVHSRLIERLQQAGVEFTETQHDPVFTSVEAARVRGVDLHSGAKALVLKSDHGFLLAVMPADLKLDGSALRKHLRSRRLRFADKNELAELTGLTPGAVPPFGSLFDLPTVCDERLGDNEFINFNAASHERSVQMRFDDYMRIEDPTLTRFACPAG